VAPDKVSHVGFKHPIICITLSQKRQFAKKCHDINTLHSMSISSFKFIMLYAQSVSATDEGFQEASLKILRKYGISNLVTH